MPDLPPDWTVHVPAEEEPQRSRPQQEKQTQARRLVDLVEEHYRLVTTPDGVDQYAIERHGPNIAYPLRAKSGSLRSALANKYRCTYGSPPSQTSLVDAFVDLEHVAAKAPREHVGLRVAVHGTGVVVDIGDETGRAIVVEPGHWKVVDRSPVPFRRTEMISPMPCPVRGGSLDELAALLNVPATKFDLLTGWMLACWRPHVPAPVLLLSGEQGTAKSTATTTIASIVDPSPAALRGSPRDDEAWIQQTKACRLAVIDNASSIPSWLSDCICRTCTGDAYFARRKYTDDSILLSKVQRAVLINSIDVAAIRGDLGERLLIIDLRRIEPKDRKDEEDLNRIFADAHPRILGALLDRFASTLERLPDAKPTQRTRMSDFSRLLAAMDAACGTAALDTYLSQDGRVAEDVIDSSPVAQWVVEIIKQTGPWSGTAGDLLKLKEKPLPKHWPQSARAMGGQLRRLAPALRSLGFEIEMPTEGGRKGRIFTINPPKESDGGTDLPWFAPGPPPSPAGGHNIEEVEL
jgi:hypothetical protein